MNVKELISPILQLEERHRRNRAWVISVCALLLINSAIGIYFIVSVPKGGNSVVAPPAPVHVGSPTVVATPNIEHRELTRHITPTYTPQTKPQNWAAPSNNGSVWRVVQTSDRRMQSYGGGAERGQQTNGTTQKSGQNVNNNIAPVTSFVALQARKQLADAGAMEAPQMAQMAALPTRKAPGPPNPPGPLPDDHQLVEHPLPDGMLTLLIMAIVFAIGRFFAEKYYKKHEQFAQSK